MKVFIAGGGGYIGSRLVPDLLEHGYEVTVLDLFWFGNFLPPGVKTFTKDVFETTEEDVRGFDAVIFLSGLSNDPMAEYSPAMNFKLNSAAAGYLAYISKEAGVPRFIHAGSCSVYGLTEDGMTTEDEHPRTVHPYGISKLMGELSALQVQSSDFSVICLRQGTVSGWSPRMRLDLVANAMYARAREEGVIVVNNPHIWRPLFSITDALTVYRASLEAPMHVSGVFNVASENVSISDIAKRIQKHFAKKNKKVDIETKEIADVRNYRVSTKRAQEVLGVTFTGSVENIMEDLDANLPEVFDFSDDANYNIRTFQKLFAK